MKSFLISLALLITLSISAVESKEAQIEIVYDEIEAMEDDSLKVMKYFVIWDLLNEKSDEKEEAANKALQISQEIGWGNGIGLSYHYLGWYYFFKSNRIAAMTNFLKAAEFTADPTIKVDSYGLVANLYSWEKKHDLAEEYALKGWKVVDNNWVDRKAKVTALLYLTEVYRYSGDKKKERHCILHALHILNTDPQKYDPSKTMLWMMVWIYLQGNPIEDPFSILNYSMNVKSAYDNASTLEKYKNIVWLNKVGTSYTMSAYNEGVLKAESDQKKYIYGGVVILLLVVVILIWQNQSRKKAIVELAKANEMKSRFFGILNHDLRRPVASIISYLQLKNMDSDAISTEEALVFEQKTINRTKKLLENMEDLLFWCKDQMHSFTPDFRFVLVSTLFDDTKAFFSYDEKVFIEFEKISNLKIKTDENYVKTIMRNLTSNSLTATSAIKSPVIRWRAYTSGNKIVLSIFNNGAKVPQDKINILERKGSEGERNIKEGLGLNIVRDLAKSINCEIHVVSNDQGTEFKLFFDKP